MRQTLALAPKGVLNQQSIALWGSCRDNRYTPEASLFKKIFRKFCYSQKIPNVSSPQLIQASKSSEQNNRGSQPVFLKYQRSLLAKASRIFNQTPSRIFFRSQAKLSCGPPSIRPFKMRHQNILLVRFNNHGMNIIFTADTFGVTQMG